MASPNQITVKQLGRLIGTPQAPVVVDLRVPEDFDEDPRLIPGAFRHPFREAEALANVAAGQTMVVYCQKGLKISEGAAAILRAAGRMALALEGGQFGWRDAGLPLVPAAMLPARGADGRTTWVTRHRPKVDRIACPWLIRRFVDPRARFLFVAPATVGDVADKFEATPFDVPDSYWSHSGDRCTFDAMVTGFGLETPALTRLAELVRGADTDRHDLAPEVAGLLAASLGLSRMYRDDLAQLEAGMLLYDAFYRWARDATDESHNWPAEHVGRSA